MKRCADCLSDLDSPVFWVIKTDVTRVYDDEEKKLSAHLYEAFVCEDCAGWYGDEAMYLEEAPA